MTQHEWGLLIVIYLFCGGLGAGCLALAGAAHLMPRGGYRGIARAGAIVAPLLVAFGSGLLVFDLGRPFNFWRLFVTVVPVSPMSIGSWLLMGFVPIGAVTALLQLPSGWLRAAAPRKGRLSRALTTLAAWNDVLDDPEAMAPRSVGAAAAVPAWVPRARNFLAVIGIPIGLGVGIYTGVLLGAIPARPFWNTPMVAQLFLFSALSTASALLMLAVPWIERGAGSELHDEQRALVAADLVFIFLELFIIIPFIVHGELSVLSARDALAMVLGGPYTLAFWGGVVALGIVLPALAELIDLFGHVRAAGLRRTLHVAVPLLILCGGFLLRWIFVHAGQDTHFAD